MNDIVTPMMEMSDVIVLAEDDTRLLCEIDEGEDPVWIDKADIDDDLSEVRGEGDTGRLVIPVWVAKRLNLVP